MSANVAIFVCACLFYLAVAFLISLVRQRRQKAAARQVRQRLN